MLRHPLDRALPGLTKPVGIDRLQQIIHGMGLEGANGIAIVGGDEHDRRYRVGSHSLQHIETTDAAQLHIQEEHVRCVPSDGVNGRGAVAAFGYDFRVG